MSRPIALGCLAAVLAICFFPIRHRLSQTPHSSGARPAAAAEVPTLVKALRPVYPFSVIPGGAYSAAELMAQAERDAVVKLHYADFRTSETHLTQLEQDQFEYVSYRKQNRIFWTPKKLRIPKGELVLTDGVHKARARCGNRLADLRPPNAEFQAPLADLNLPAMSPELLGDNRITFASPPAVGSGVSFPVPEQQFISSFGGVFPDVGPGTQKGGVTPGYPPNGLTFLTGLTVPYELPTGPAGGGTPPGNGGGGTTTGGGGTSPGGGGSTGGNGGSGGNTGNGGSGGTSPKPPYVTPPVPIGTIPEPRELIVAGLAVVGLALLVLRARADGIQPRQ